MELYEHVRYGLKIVLQASELAPLSSAVLD